MDGGGDSGRWVQGSGPEAPVSAQRHRKAHRSAQTSSGTPSITRAAASAEAGDKTRGVDKMVKSLYRPPMPRRCRRRGSRPTCTWCGRVCRACPKKRAAARVSGCGRHPTMSDPWEPRPRQTHSSPSWAVPANDRWCDERASGEEEEDDPHAYLPDREALEVEQRRCEGLARGVALWGGTNKGSRAHRRPAVDISTGCLVLRGGGNGQRRT